MKTDPEIFIRANTSLMAPPHVPEIRLHLASEADELWLKTQEELAEIGLPPPFWAFAWAGGQGLARYILDHPETVRGKRVFDFATGSGLVGIAAKLAGAAAVRAVDIDPWAETAVRLNAAANKISVDFDAADLVGQDVDADVVLAGDVFYDRAFAEALVPWFERLSGEGKEISRRRSGTRLSAEKAAGVLRDLRSPGDAGARGQRDQEDDSLAVQGLITQTLAS